VLQAPEQTFPCSPWSRPWQGRLSLQPMETHRGADPHLKPMEDPTPEQGDAQRML